MPAAGSAGAKGRVHRGDTVPAESFARIPGGTEAGLHVMPGHGVPSAGGRNIAAALRGKLCPRAIVTPAARRS